MLIIAKSVIPWLGREIPSCDTIRIHASRIDDLGQAGALLGRYPRDRVLDLGNSIVLPGLVNVHAHLELPPIAKKVKAGEYALWVLRLLRAKQQMSSSDYRKAALANCATLLETGTTTVGEISTHGASPSIIRKSGLRSVVYHEIIAIRPGDRARIPQRLSPTALIAHGLSPHSPHTTSPEVLEKVRSLAIRRHLRLCMHVAETLDEGLLLQREPGGLDKLYAAAGWSRSWAPSDRSSFAYLERSGVLSERFLAVHAVHADARDRTIIRRTRTPIAHCPRSNRALHVGTLPLKSYLDQGIVVGLGTDSLASVPTLSLWDEMRAALEIHGPTGIFARDLLRIATEGGAKALGLNEQIGTLEPGRRADLIAVPSPRRSSGDICSDLLRETKSCTMTMVNGTVLYRSIPARS